VPEIQPFPGVLYRVPEAELGRVLAPPYDVIPPTYQDELYARDPRNIVRVILNKTEGDAGYQEAGETYKRWLEQGVLAADSTPALYVLEQSFMVGERRLRRYGLLARFRAEDPAKGVVLPHEQTRSAAKEDRWRVLKATRANFSPIFLMFPDTGRFSARVAQILGTPAALAYTDDGGVRHRLWRVTDPPSVQAFQEAIGSVKAYIADGHHRYATALRYRDEVGADGAWTLGYFTPLDAPGLLVLPYHRLLSEGPSLAEARAALGGRFLLSDAPGVSEAAQAVAESQAPYAFGLAEPGGGALVAEALPEAVQALMPESTPRSLKALDTYFVHQGVLARMLKVPDQAVSYVHSLAEADDAVREGRCRLALLMRGTPVRHIVDVAEARESMPAKSTFFHPKLPSGLVIHPLMA
jgi:uncharacterized protein (DUF1015 family)